MPLPLLLPAVKFIKSPLFKYILFAAVVLGVLFAVYSHGKSVVQTKWDAQKEIDAARIRELEANQGKVTIVKEIEYVDRIKIVKVKGDTIVEYVDRWLTPEDNAKCVLPKNFYSLHNLGALNKAPATINDGVLNGNNK